MAVINVTPDSFSDGGLHLDPAEAVGHGLRAIDEGADIVDIGGESTRPNAEPVTAEEEQARILPVIAALALDGRALISVDTYRAETARRAIEAGAHIVNDVTGLQGDPGIARLVADTGAGLVAMHTGRNRHKLSDMIADQQMFFDLTLGIADAAGINRSQIVLDPGFGFAKETAEENFDLMARFEVLHSFRLPFLAGTSRKRFLGAASGKAAAERDVATAASSAILRVKGAALFRVHNVAINKDALAVADAMLATMRPMAAAHSAGAPQ